MNVDNSPEKRIDKYQRLFLALFWYAAGSFVFTTTYENRESNVLVGGAGFLLSSIYGCGDAVFPVDTALFTMPATLTTGLGALIPVDTYDKAAAASLPVITLPSNNGPTTLSDAI
jgi:hypothetical protein